jgi:hypothetical protein
MNCVMYSTIFTNWKSKIIKYQAKENENEPKIKYPFPLSAIADEYPFICTAAKFFA